MFNRHSSFWMFWITNKISMLYNRRSYQIRTTWCIIFADASTAILECCGCFYSSTKNSLLGLLIWCCCNCTEGNFSLWDWGKSEILPEKNIVGWNWKSKVCVHACSITSSLRSIYLAIISTYWILKCMMNEINIDIHAFDLSLLFSEEYIQEEPCSPD